MSNNKHIGVDSNALYKLGISYLDGDGVEADPKKAFLYFEKSAEQGNVDAQNMLGLCFDEGIGINSDKEKAIHWYRKAAEHGKAAAQYNLGLCLYNGDGVDNNADKALFWLRKAAKQNFKEAIDFLQTIDDPSVQKVSKDKNSPNIFSLLLPKDGYEELRILWKENGKYVIGVLMVLLSMLLGCFI